MKDIKDYLHLYLGCDCMMTRNSYHAVHQLRLSSDTPFKLTGQLSDYFSDSKTMAECKPILRPLSDMTEEEEKEYEATRVFVRATPVHQVGNMQWTPETFRYLLKQGFDLFNLIPEGLAIDKTKLK